MAYCSNCGMAFEQGAKFCSGCGTTLSGAQSTALGATAPTPVTRVVVEPKRGGRLAFKGFLAALILAIIFVAATKNDKSAQAVGMVIAFGVGAAYIITNLRKWNRNNDVVHSAGIAWTGAVFLLLMCFGGLMNVGNTGSNTGSTGSSSASTSTGSGSASSVSTEIPDIPADSPKDVLLRDVKLVFKWRKEGFGGIMIADFTIKNPTQYRFKDFEIKCTHSAPSGTVIDSNTRTVYETVEPKSTKVIREMNMGFIHSQATRSGCEITDLVVIR